MTTHGKGGKVQAYTGLTPDQLERVDGMAEKLALSRSAYIAMWLGVGTEWLEQTPRVADKLAHLRNPEPALLAQISGPRAAGTRVFQEPTQA
ncbi:MAG TPA: hypothetical protein VJY65_13680 [Chloroflexota bacterium]|nr:hypothetical protein [Chloroflexota bacterium]